MQILNFPELFLVNWIYIDVNENYAFNKAKLIVCISLKLFSFMYIYVFCHMFTYLQYDLLTLQVVKHVSAYVLLLNKKFFFVL